MSDNQCAQAKPEELCASTLRHYEEISDKACYWVSTIPAAIKFWYLEKPKLERELAAALALSEERRVMLEKLQWVRDECEICWHTMVHAPDCALARLIKEETK